ncbi:MAG TPA: aspartate aminotransferase family protein [Firmicutes bacterium]|nr:aspartate aminotransferase family protein [Bacillota bacterium]
MGMKNIKEKAEKYLINTYNRKPDTPLFLKGEGACLTDDEGNEYLDFLSGLGVNGLGHCHPQVVEAVTKQASLLMHTSNLYYTEPQVELAALLVENSALDKVFFSNSGAEANEGAMKLARKYYREKGEDRYEIITFINSFHGRTMATLTATGQEKYRQGFQPLLPGIKYARFNDLDSVLQLLTPQTCAVMLEPIQGESGVYPADPVFLKNLKDLCLERDVLLIFDEVQCGLGRTGKLFAYENYGVAPDILTLAKCLGGGLPIGAFLAREEVAAAFKPGDHASTFGGNPVACAAGCAVLRTLLGGLLAEGREKGEFFLAELKRIKSPLIKEIRGKGLMVGVELKAGGKEIYRALMEKRVLCNLINGTILRFLPPLIVDREEIASVAGLLGRLLIEYAEN